MKNSFKLITVLGIPIEINISWFVILGLVIFTLAKGYFPLQIPNLTLTQYWLMGFIAALLLFVCLVLHELSHAVVAKLNNLPIAGITLFVFGGVAHMECEPDSPTVEFRMAIAGPIMSLFLSFLFWLMSISAMRLSLAPAIWLVTDYLSFFNLAIAIFNLTPGFPLDGGRVLRAVLWHFSKNLRSATHTASVLGEGVAVIMIALGFLALITSNFISGVWFIFLGFFLLEAAQLSYKQLIVKRALTGVRVKDIMSKNVITVPSDISINDLIENYFFKFRHNCFPVISDDTILGIVTFHDAKAVEKSAWKVVSAKDIMLPINNGFITTENLQADEVLQAVARNGVGRLLVIDDNKLVGIISQTDIIKLFKFREEASK